MGKPGADEPRRACTTAFAPPPGGWYRATMISHKGERGLARRQGKGERGDRLS